MPPLPKIERAITICQPWAAMVSLGLKNVENRTWKTPFRGLVAIHSSTSNRDFTIETQDRLLDIGHPHIEALFNNPLEADDSTPIDDLLFDSGKIIGAVEIVDCVPISQIAQPHEVQASPDGGLPHAVWADGPFCFILANAVRFKNKIAAKGALNIWHMQPELAEAVTAEYYASKALKHKEAFIARAVEACEKAKMVSA